MTIQTTQIDKSLIPSKPVNIRQAKTIKSKVLNIRGSVNPEFKFKDSHLDRFAYSHFKVATKQRCFKNSSEQIA